MEYSVTLLHLLPSLLFQYCMCNTSATYSRATMGWDSKTSKCAFILQRVKLSNSAGTFVTMASQTEPGTSSFDIGPSSQL
jgi:hypothetical protein